MQISQKKINLGESCFKMKSINRKGRKELKNKSFVFVCFAFFPTEC
jgi:hypothetical protein